MVYCTLYHLRFIWHLSCGLTLSVTLVFSSHLLIELVSIL